MLESASLYPPLISQQALLRGHVIQMLVWMGLVMASVAQIFKQDFTPGQAAWSHYSLLWEQGNLPRDKKSPNALKWTLQPTTFSLQRLTPVAVSSHKSINKSSKQSVILSFFLSDKTEIKVHLKEIYRRICNYDLAHFLLHFFLSVFFLFFLFTFYSLFFYSFSRSCLDFVCF